jgi:cytoskeleton protein RodZ
MFEIGNTLREARLRRGLDILDCEAETKIRAKYLRAMEEEQFDLMPSSTYVRGFLRTYADFLDLDGRLVLDEYESRFGAYSLSQEGGARPGRPSRSEPGAPRGAPEPPRRGRPRKRRRTELQLLWLAIGGVMAVALLIWLGVGQSDTPAPMQPAATTSAGPRSVPAVVEPDTASTEAPVRAKKTQIILAGTGVNGCWVQVRSRNADGRIVFEQILTPGQSTTFRVTQGIWVNASNPAELVVTVGGKVKDLKSTSGGTWLITPTGAKSLG